MWHDHTSKLVLPNGGSTALEGALQNTMFQSQKLQVCYLYGAPLSELSLSSSLAVVAVSFSGLFTFIFLMLACLCCKKGDIGFKDFGNAEGEEFHAAVLECSIVPLIPEGEEFHAEEFENAEGEEFHAEVSTLASPASQSGGPEVYVLPLTEVSRPLNKQPGRAVQLVKSSDVGRHNLLYIKEIGHGWFGKVLLGEVTGCGGGGSSRQVVVKELKTSATRQQQIRFLEEAKPFRGLQHPALLQCVAQCTEASPYLLVMEFCPLGDVKGYLRSCRAADSVTSNPPLTPEPLLLQRMACDIASGLLHLHTHHFIHGDLALRNCLLTSDVTVKIGDYGLAQSKYKDDYYVTSDQAMVPLRWMAPELVDDVHGNLLVADQTKQSNIWSLGVTIWELFELGSQPYRLYSDRQVLSYAVKEQQLKLPKPLLKIPLAERWYEVMQFCWLQADQRPNAEEVHLLLSYLVAKSASEAEDDFERRWNSMRPNTNVKYQHCADSLAMEMGASSSSSSFPLLEHFSVADNYHSDSGGDDILTVTETSHGLNFEYKWEQARAEQSSYHHSSSTGTLGQGNPLCQEVYYPPVVEALSLGVSPSYYEAKQQPLHGAGVVPVLSAHSPSVTSDYYIRIEEPTERSVNVDMDYAMVSYSPEFGGSNGGFLTGGGGEAEVKPRDSSSYWAADVHKSHHTGYDSDNTSPALSLTMEPLLGQVAGSSPLRPWESGHYVSYKDRDGGYYYEHSPPITMEGYIIGKPPLDQHHQESWGSRSLRRALGELDNPLGISPSSPSRHRYGDPLGIAPSVDDGPRQRQGYGDPYLETSHHHLETSHPASAIIGKNVTGGYYDMMGSLRKTMPNAHQVSIDIEAEGALFLRHGDSDSEDDDDDEEDIFVERQARGWSGLPTITSSSAAAVTSASSGVCRRQASVCQQQDAYMAFHYTMPTTDVEDCWSDEQKLAYHHPTKPIDYHHPSKPIDYHHTSKPIEYLEPATGKDSGCFAHGGHYPLVAAECNPYVYICHEALPLPEKVLPVECCQVMETSPHFIDPLTGAVVRNCYMKDYEKIIGAAAPTPNEIKKENVKEPSSSSGGGESTTAKSKANSVNKSTQYEITEQYVEITVEEPSVKAAEESAIKEDSPPTESQTVEITTVSQTVEVPTSHTIEKQSPAIVAIVQSSEPNSELSRTADSGIERGQSSVSVSLVEIDDCSDDDITDVTSAIFGDFTVDYVETGDYATSASPALKSLQKQVGTPDSMDSLNLLSATGSSEGLSPASNPSSLSPASHPSTHPNALDSSSFDSSPKTMDSGYDSSPKGMDSGFDSSPKTMDSGYDSSPKTMDSSSYDSSPKVMDSGYDSSTKAMDSGYDSTPKAMDSGYDSSPKAMDSGYDTENNESPEFVLKEPHESQQEAKGAFTQQEAKGAFIQQEAKGAFTQQEAKGAFTQQEAKGAFIQQEAKGPFTQEMKGAFNQAEVKGAFTQPLEKPIMSATSLDEEREESDEAAASSTSLTASQSSEGGLVALSQDIPYRDSAYFSDYDTEGDKAPREDEKEEKGECQRQGSCEVIKEITTPEESQEEKEVKDVHGKESDDSQLEILETEETDSTPSPPPPLHSPEESQVKLTLPDGGPTIEADSGEQLLSEQSADQEERSCTPILFSDVVSKETEETEAADIPSQSHDFNETNDTNESIPGVELEDHELVLESEEVEGNTGFPLNPPERDNKEDTSDTVRTASPDTSCNKGQESSSNQEAGREVHCKTSTTRTSSPPPPHSPLAGRVSPAEGEEADEEDGDTDDSDESDEELRTYSVQEQSEESEDESHPVPIIISDCSDAHNLRSLLKRPTEVNDSSLDEPESKKKVVSFFDDVTVYLFDQESPTRELADQDFPPGAETSKKGTHCKRPHSHDKVNASDDSSDGNISEESAGYEWEDDFPLLPLKTSSPKSPKAPKSSPPPQPAAPKQPAVSTETKPTIQYSRFTVSPSPISRFSITHVTDSDMESAGGSSEDGDRE
ncbi:serine/threonine-protein kinase LMTK1 [Engraulis encrasicolus]|uniref:serine/threonine-protein kinase LMTK1 n=1 Tax=Engraulis encrasicolus TaxID=184585 RepID=UPI002FD032CE